jgi:hypothetical protein
MVIYGVYIRFWPTLSTRQELIIIKWIVFKASSLSNLYHDSTRPEFRLRVACCLSEPVLKASFVYDTHKDLWFGTKIRRCSFH